MKWLRPEDLEAMSIGSAILSAGGGGDPTSEKLIARRQLELQGPVKLIEVKELKDEDVVVPLAYMGAPLTFIEKIPSGQEFHFILQNITKYLGKKPTVLMPVEIGGANAFPPLAVAAALKLPVLDADGMGRAFPELQMTSFSLHGHAASPAFMGDSKGNGVVINGRNHLEVETIARNLTMAMGCSSAVAFHVMTGLQARQFCLERSVTRACEIGEGVLCAEKENRNPIAEILRQTEGLLLGQGLITDIEQKISSGFKRGNVNICNTSDNSQLQIYFQNENIAAFKNQKVIATGPDIISIVDAQTGRAIAIENLAHGLNVAVLGIPCHPIWKTEKGLQAVGPRYFGYSFDYVPLKKDSKR